MRRAVLLLLTLAACAPLRYAHYPWRGPLVCVQNRADGRW